MSTFCDEACAFLFSQANPDEADQESEADPKTYALKLPEKAGATGEEPSGDQEQSDNTGESAEDGPHEEDGTVEEEQRGDTEKGESGEDRGGNASNRSATEDQEGAEDLDLKEDFSCEDNEEEHGSTQNEEGESTAEPSVPHTDGEKEEGTGTEERLGVAEQAGGPGGEHDEDHDQENASEKGNDEEGDGHGDNDCSGQTLDGATEGKKEKSFGHAHRDGRYFGNRQTCLHSGVGSLQADDVCLPSTEPTSIELSILSVQGNTVPACLKS